MVTLIIAEKMGRLAYKRGLITPASDKNFLTSLRGVQVGEGKPYLKAWIRGWNKMARGQNNVRKKKI